MRSSSKKAWAALGLAVALILSAGPARAVGGVLVKRVAIDLEDASPADTFRSIGQMAGLNVTVDPALRGPVTIRVRNVYLSTVLDAICQSIGCDWVLKEDEKPPRLEIVPSPAPGPTGVVVPEEPIDVKVTNADVHEILRTFAMMGGFELDQSPEVAGAVTLQIDNMPYNKALDELCRAAKCEWKVMPGDPPRLQITPVKK